MEQYLSSTVFMATLSPGRNKIQAKRMKTTAKGSSSSSNKNSKRKSLQILQPSARNQCTLVGVDGVIATNTKQKQFSGKRKVLSNGNEGRPRKMSRSNDDPQENESDIKGSGKNCGKERQSVEKNGSQKKFTIFEDTSSARSDSDVEKAKTAEEEAYELMVQEPAPDSYWKQLAEQRREALEDTLRENEQLHDEVAELKAENERLKVMADQAEYLASVVQELMGEDKEEEEDTKQTEDDTRQDSHPLESEQNNSSQTRRGTSESNEETNGDELVSDSTDDSDL